MSDATIETHESGQDVAVSIVIPCFNEEETISRTVDAISAYLNSHYPDTSAELILVNDGSSDRTGDILDSAQADPIRVRPHHFDYNRGRGAAIKAGISMSRGDRVLCLDADLSYDVDHIGEILHEFDIDPRTDVVVVSPYMKGGTVKNVPWNRLMLSRLANWILAGFFAGKLSTVTCVVRGYRGSLLRSIPMFEDGKELHLEMLRKLALCGATIVEIPGRLVWKNQHAQPRRKTNFKVIGAASRHLLYGLLIKPTRFFKYIAALLLFILLGIQAFSFLALL